MRASLVILTTSALIGTACGGSSDDSGAATDPPATQTTEQPAPVSTDPPPAETLVTEPPATDPPPDVPGPPDIVAVFSDDDDLGARYTDNGDGPAVSARLLEPSEWPIEVAGGVDAPGVKIYEMTPDGAVFDEPVMVTRRIDIAAFESLGLGPFDVPLVTMLTQNADGDFDVLDDLTLLRLGDDLYVSGTTTHFSPIIISNENRMIPFGPGEGDGFTPAKAVDPEKWADVSPEEFVEAMRETIGPESGPVVAEERWLSADELLDYVHKVIEEQEAAGESGGADDERPPPPTRPVFVLPADGPLIESVPIEPVVEPLAPEEGAYRAERFGTEFPTIPISMLPSTSALVGDDITSISITVYAIALVIPTLVIESGDPNDVPVTGPSADSEARDDCFMYLEDYPELLEVDPSLAQLCDTDAIAAQAIISEQLFGDS